MNKFLQLAALLCSLNAISQTGGVLDTSFGTAGKVVTSINAGADKAYGVVLQTDGKIVVGGMTTSAVSGKDFACVRYNIDGSLDTTFGTGGIVTTDIQTGSDDVAYSIAIQADGKILLAGYTDSGTNKDAAILRLNIDGTVDTTFGTAGIVITDLIAGKADEIKTIKIHTLTGNIIVGGSSATTSTNAQGVIARYTSAGVLDTSFNTTGKVALPNASGNGAYFNSIEDMAVKSNGKITAVGWVNQQGLQWSSNYYGCRLNSDGVLDATFAGDGVIVTNGGFNGNDKAFSMLLNTDDSILYGGGGYLTTLEYDFFLGYFDSAGATAVGKASFDYDELAEDIAYGMGMDSAGKIVLAGSTISGLNPGSSSFAIARVNANYTVDNTFGSAGKVTTTFGTNAGNEAFDVAIQSDDKIIAVGYTGNDFALARYGNATVSLNDAHKITVSVYPNPVNNVLNFTINNNSDNTVFEIIDLNGRKVFEGHTNGTNESVNVETLSSGMYILKVNQAFAKFIKG